MCLSPHTIKRKSNTSLSKSIYRYLLFKLSANIERKWTGQILIVYNRWGRQWRSIHKHCPEQICLIQTLILRRHRWIANYLPNQCVRCFSSVIRFTPQERKGEKIFTFVSFFSFLLVFLLLFSLFPYLPFSVLFYFIFLSSFLISFFCFPFLFSLS